MADIGQSESEGCIEACRVLLEGMPEPVIVLDGIGTLLYSNKKAAEIFWLNDTTVQGKNLADFSFIPKEKRAVVKEVIASLALGKAPEKLEITVTRKPPSRVFDVSFTELKRGGANRWLAVFRDVTRRILAERALAEEKDLARRYLDIADTVLVAIDSSQKVSFINWKGCRILGYAPEQIVGKNWFDAFLPREAREGARKEFKRLMAGRGGGTSRFENQILTKIGRERSIAWHNTVVKDQDGGIIGTLSSGEDVTEKRRDEKERNELSQELEQQRRIMDEVLSTTAHHLFMIDRNLRCIYANKEGAKKLGVPRSRLVGGHWKDLKLPMETADKIEQDVLEVFSAGKPLHGETFYQTALGKQYFEYAMTPGHDEDGKVSYVIVSSRNITERKIMEGELRKSESRYKDLIETLPESITVLDRDGKILLINRKSAGRFNRHPEDCLRRNIWELIPPSSAAFRKDVLVRIFETGKAKAMDSPAGIMGVKRWYRIVFHPLRDENSRVSSVMVISSDITEQRRVWERLKKLESGRRKVSGGKKR